MFAMLGSVSERVCMCFCIPGENTCNVQYLCVYLSGNLNLVTSPEAVH